jgi:hypothetical protein
MASFGIFEDSLVAQLDPIGNKAPHIHAKRTHEHSK